jgi:uncharacterized membrane protein YkvA (DUF1232 family)
MIARLIALRIKESLRSARRDVVALWLAARDPRTPWHAKLVAAAVAAYAMSPIDLVPDFILVLGHLDDLVIVPLGIMLAVALVPKELMAEFRAEADAREATRSPAGAIAIVLIWIAAALLLLWWFWSSGAR